MRIIVDAMGGDNAPQAPVMGAVRAASELGVDVTLVGRREEIEKYLGSAAGVTVVDAREVISMEDDPSTATRRKKDSSMAVALNMLKNGEGDAVVSAGSTGALLTGATLTVKRVRGIRRAALAQSDEITEELKRTDVTTLTPIEAMNLLFKLSKKAQNA